MFGYVKICKPRLTCGDYELYQGVYCSLCKALGRRYGLPARLALTYDMTFYALLAIQEGPGAGEAAQFSAGRCSFNPTKRCLNCKHSALEFAADVSILMAYYHWRDNLQDGGFWARLLWSLPAPFFLWAGRKAKKRAPQAEQIIRTAVTAQRLVEENPHSADGCAHPSAHALGALCSLLDQRLYRLGYLLGRWVYLMDAADDYTEDVRRGRFNPFASFPGAPWETIAATQAEMERAWQALAMQPDAPFQAVFENVFTLGLPDMQVFIKEKTEQKQT